MSLRVYLLLAVLLLPATAGLAQPAGELPTEPDRRALLFSKRAGDLLRRGQSDSAWRYNLRPALALMPALSMSDSARRQLHQTLGMYYYYTHRSADAIREWKTVVLLGEVAADTPRLIQGHYNLSATYANIGLYREAVDHSLRNLRLHVRPDRPYKLSTTYAMLATNYRQLNDTRLAWHYDTLALRYAVLGRTEDPAWHYLLRGEKYAESHRHALAVGQFRQFISIRNQQHNRENVAYCLLHMAQSLEKLKQTGQARRVAQEAIDAGRLDGDRGIEAESYGFLARLWQQEGRWQESLQAARRSVALLWGNEYVMLIPAALTLLANAEEQAGQPRAALQTLRRSQRLTDSLQVINKVEVVAAIQATFDVEQKDAQINALNQALTIRRLEQQTTGIVIGFLLVVVGLTGLFWFRAQRRGRVLVRQKAEIQAQAARLAGLNRVKDQLFSIVSHDLRGPMTTLLQTLNRLGPPDLPGLTQARQSVQQLVMLIDNMLLWALSQLGGLRLNPEPVSVVDELADVLALFAEPIRARGLRVEGLPLTLPPVLADAVQTEIILRNVLQNAIKFSPPGGQLLIRAMAQPDRVSLSVADEGPGFDWAAVQAGWATGDGPVPGGTGLGLQIVADLMHRNGGTLQIVPRPGQAGTLVTLSWLVDES